MEQPPCDNWCPMWACVCVVEIENLVKFGPLDGATFNDQQVNKSDKLQRVNSEPLQQVSNSGKEQLTIGSC